MFSFLLKPHEISSSYVYRKLKQKLCQIKEFVDFTTKGLNPMYCVYPEGADIFEMIKMEYTPRNDHFSNRNSTFGQMLVLVTF